MIAVVTGGSGFVGSNLIERLVADGHAVRGLVRPGGGALPEAVESYHVDFAEPRTLRGALHGCDVVFHLAGATRARRSSDFHRANVVTTRSIVAALRDARLTPRFVYVSSQAAAGPAPSLGAPVHEGEQPRPVEAYGKSKLQAERVVTEEGKHLPTTILRPASVIGPRDRDFLVLFRSIARGIGVYPVSRDHWLSVVHVADLVTTMLRAADAPAAVGRTYFVANAAPASWRQIGEAIAMSMGRSAIHLSAPWPLVRLAALAGEGFSLLTGTTTLATRSKVELARHPYWVCDGSRARDELGFNESLTLMDAVRDTYLWYVKQGWLPRARTGQDA